MRMSISEEGKIELQNVRLGYEYGCDDWDVWSIMKDKAVNKQPA